MWFRSQAHGVILPNDRHPESGKLFLFLPSLFADELQKKQSESTKNWLMWKHKNDLKCNRLDAKSYRYGLELLDGMVVPPFQGLNSLPFLNQQQWIKAHKDFKLNLHLHFAGLGYGYYIHDGCPHGVINTCGHLGSVAWDDWCPGAGLSIYHQPKSRPYRSPNEKANAHICLTCGRGSSFDRGIHGCCRQTCQAGYHLQCATSHPDVFAAITNRVQWTCLLHHER